MVESLNWDAVYEIALALKTKYPHVKLDEISLEDVFNFTIELSIFEDDPNLANDDILTAIFQEWYEECNPI